MPLIEQLSALNLPIVSQLDQIVQAATNHPNIIIKAEPGAGKTTVVPLALLTIIEPNKKILLLQPRRVAVKNTAQRLSEMTQKPVGDLVGYRMRQQTKVNRQTRIEVITEGVLLRLLQSDPELTDVGLIIFDEFHERSMNADLGLAFSLEVQSSLRDDLKLVLMSATLHPEEIVRLLQCQSQSQSQSQDQNQIQNDQSVPVINCQGRSFPVAIHYTQLKPNQTWQNALVSQLRALLASDKSNENVSQGDILVFLPGIADILRIETEIKQRIRNLPSSLWDWQVLTLYGKLPIEAQRAVVKPLNNRGANQRRIILATNIAETSLTIDGITHVIDSGLEKQSRFDPNIGFDRLHTRRISSASATQRAGRAGRLGAGVCIRIWSESERLIKQTTPEILRADLASFLLQNFCWGNGAIDELALLDRPSSGAVEQAKQLLKSIGAVDNNGKLTGHGKRIDNLGVHPRIAHMLLASAEWNVSELACVIAVLLEEGSNANRQTNGFDFLLEIQAAIFSLSSKNNPYAQQVGLLYKKLQPHSAPADASQSRSVLAAKAGEQIEYAAKLCALAFSDRIALKQSANYRLANGKMVRLDAEYANTDLLVVIRQGGSGEVAKIFSFIELDSTEFLELFSEQIAWQETIFWCDKSQAIKGEKQKRYQSLVLERQALTITDEPQRVQGLLQGIRQLAKSVSKEGYCLSHLPWNNKLRSWQQRVILFSDLEPNMKKLNDQWLLDHLLDWLGPFIGEFTKLSQITTAILEQALYALLDYEQQKRLDSEIPETIQVASGRRVTLDYLQGDIPVLAVKLQEMFGETSTPLIANGKVPLVIHLLSPAKRPLQVTSDLASFWKNGYPQVKKEMKGRYPKHPWPDDPLQAVATIRTKKHLK